MDDDEIVVIEPDHRKRSRGDSGRPVPETAAEVIDQTTDLKRARNVIEDVNRYRMLLAKRLSNMVLFPSGTKPIDWRSAPMDTDPPQIQIIFQLRQELNTAAGIADDYQRTQCRTTLLKAMNDTINKATEEAGAAAEQYRKMIDSAAKLEIERDKNGGSINPADVYRQAKLT